MSTLLRRAAAVIATIALALLGAGGAAAASPFAGETPAPSPGPGEESAPATFGVSPASPAGPDSRPFVVIGAAPGSVVTDYVAVLNQSDFSLPLSVYPSEATQAQDGTLTLANRGAVSDAGSWLTLGAATVDVPAQSSAGIGSVVVPVTVTIPADAEPGDHVGAVIVSLTASGPGGENAPSLDFEQRVGARIYIHVTGETAPGLVVTQVSARYDHGPLWGLPGRGRLTVTYALHNTGNVRVAVQPSVSAAGPFGLLPAEADGSMVNELLPDGVVTQEVVIDDVWPLVRRHITVSAAARTAPGGAAVTLDPATRSADAWTVPWLWLVLLLLATLAVFRRRLRRLMPPRWSRPARRGRHGPGTPVPAPADPPALDATPV